jgi:hypothetical protein
MLRRRACEIYCVDVVLLARVRRVLRIKRDYGFAYCWHGVCGLTWERHCEIAKVLVCTILNMVELDGEQEETGRSA